MNDGSIYGMGNATNTYQKGYLVKLSGETEAPTRLIWEQEYREAGTFHERFESFTQIDGNLYIAGRQCHTDSSCSSPFYKLHEINLTDGSRNSSITIPNPTEGTLSGLENITATSQGNLLLSCSVASTYNDACLINMSTTASLNWSWISTYPWFAGNRYASESPWGGFVFFGSAPAPDEYIVLNFNPTGAEQDRHATYEGWSNSRGFAFDSDNNMLRLFNGRDTDKPELWSTNQNGVTKVIKVFEGLNGEPRDITIDTDGSALLLFTDPESAMLVMKTHIENM